MYVVITNTSIQNQVVRHFKAVEGVSSERGSLKVWNNKAPSCTAVMLIFTIDTCCQCVSFAHREAHNDVGSVSIFLKFTFKRMWRNWHITM